MKKTLIIILMIFNIISSYSQGVDCSNASPFCTDDPAYVFPASTGVDDMGQVGCLHTTPNPAFYWMQISDPGNINIHISSSTTYGDPQDVDFICWGPFTSLSDACQTNLMSNSGVDCSYSIDAQEDCMISNALYGQVYVLLITNYANVSTNISFNQTSGSGSTNCAIMAPPIIGDTICSGDSSIISVTSPIIGAIYTWEGPNDFSVSGYQYSSINVDSSVFNHPGLYTYALTIQVGSSISNQVFCNLLVRPIYNTTTNISICNNELPYIWHNIAYNISGTYIDTLHTIYGCDSITKLNLNINPLYDTLTIVKICDNSYNWRDSIYNTTGFYSDTLHTIYGCDSILSLDLTLNKNPIIYSLGDSICAGEIAKISHTFKYGSSDTTIYTYISPTLSNYYEFIATDTNGCVSIDTTYVIVYQNPIANFTPNSITSVYNNVISFNNSSFNSQSYIWDFGDECLSNDENPIHTYNKPGIYDIWLKVESENGCIDSIHKIISIELSYDCYIPNSFTPDQDNIDEYWKPIITKNTVKSYDLTVYNRWGDVLYHTNDINSSWNGKKDGVRYPIGTYIYSLIVETLDLKIHKYIGNIYIVR